MSSKRNKRTGPVPIPGGSYGYGPAAYSGFSLPMYHSNGSIVRSQYSEEKIQSMQPTVEDVPDEGDPPPKTPPSRPIDTSELEARKRKFPTKNSKGGVDGPFKFQVEDFDLDFDANSTVESASNTSTNTSMGSSGTGITADHTSPPKPNKKETKTSTESSFGFERILSGVTALFGSKEDQKSSPPKKETPTKHKPERLDGKPRKNSPPVPEPSQKVPAPYGGTPASASRFDPSEFSSRIPAPYGGAPSKGTFSVERGDFSSKEQGDYNEAKDAATVLQGRESKPYVYKPSKDGNSKSGAAVPGGVYKIDDEFAKLNLRGDAKEKTENIFGSRTPAPYASTNPPAQEDYFTNTKPAPYSNSDSSTQESDIFGKRTPAPYSSTNVSSKKFCPSPGRQEAEWAKSKPKVHQEAYRQAENPPQTSSSYSHTYSSNKEELRPKGNEDAPRTKSPASTTTKTGAGMPTPGGNHSGTLRNETAPQTPKQQPLHTSSYTAYSSPSTHTSTHTSPYSPYSSPNTPTSPYGHYPQHNPPQQSPQPQQGSQFQYQPYHPPSQPQDPLQPSPVTSPTSQPPHIHQHTPPVVHQQFPPDSTPAAFEHRQFPQPYRGSQPRHRPQERERPAYNYVKDVPGSRKSRQTAYYAQSEPPVSSGLYADYRSGPKTDIFDGSATSATRGGRPHRSSSKKDNHGRSRSRHEQSVPLKPSTSSSSQQGGLRPAQPQEHPLNGKKGYLRPVSQYQPGNSGPAYSVSTDGKEEAYYSDMSVNMDQRVEIYDRGDGYSDSYPYDYSGDEEEFDEDNWNGVGAGSEYDRPHFDCSECTGSHRGGLRYGESGCGPGRCCFDPSCIRQHQRHI